MDQEHVRFSNGSGNPAEPDTARDGRGMAVKFYSVSVSRRTAGT